ncbi:MAG TPA: hypothetical protein VK105_07195 [Virgibacillus sp.]|nr:hypothetical protein [Virgibacillus sp.]HLR66907.1 hypothetical protein [Virgibacillus sp.]
MKLKADLFPYPVLHNEIDDYVDSKFHTDIKTKKRSQSWIDLIVDFYIENPEIENKLKDGLFAFAIHLEGVSSSYRKLIQLPKGERSITIQLSSDYISDRIEVNTMIIANRELYNYSNSFFNPLYYDDYKINIIQKGDIIAFDTMAELKIDFENKENPNAKSMIRVSSKKENYMSIDCDSDFIQVHLPEEEYDAYVKLSKSNEIKKNLLLVTIVQPALTYVIERIKAKDVHDESLQWYVALTGLLENLNYNEETLKTMDSLKLSQELLDMPLEGALSDYYEWSENQ